MQGLLLTIFPIKNCGSAGARELEEVDRLLRQPTRKRLVGSLLGALKTEHSSVVCTGVGARRLGKTETQVANSVGTVGQSRKAGR